MVAKVVTVGSEVGRSCSDRGPIRTDTTLQMSNQDAKTLFEKVNSALASASDWFRANKLTVHPSKTKYIFFSAGQHTELKSETLSLNGVAIERVGLDCETNWLNFWGCALTTSCHGLVNVPMCIRRLQQVFYASLSQKDCAMQNQIDDLQQPRLTIL